MDACKHQIKDKDKSTWANTVFRSCKLEAAEDGFCNLHRPSNVAYALERRAFEELVQEARVLAQREEQMVGAYMRLRRKEEFDAALAEIRNAEELATNMNEHRRR